MICEIKSTVYEDVVADAKKSGCKHFSLKSDAPWDLSIILKLFFLFKKQQVDVVNTHNALACWYGNIAARMAGIPVVFTLRNNQRQNYQLLLKRKPFYVAARLMDCISMRIANRVIAVSKRLEQFYIENERIPQKKISTIYNAIDLEPIKEYQKGHGAGEARKKLGIPEQSLVIGIVGDLVERKGHACLINAARIVLKKNPRLVFLVVGDGPMKAFLDRQIDQHGISDHFIFTGHVTKVFDYLSAMDVFVLPSHAEGISRALMESMAMGKPSVCSAIDGNIEAVVDGVTGFLFPVEDHQVLAEKISRLLDDVDSRTRMGKESSKRAEKVFDIKLLSQAYEALYWNLVHN